MLLDNHDDDGTGEIEPLMKEIIERLNSYTEITPSGKGFHIIVKGRLTGGGINRGIEIYDRTKYFTFTGWHLEKTPLTIEDRQEELLKLYSQYVKKVPAKSANKTRAKKNTSSGVPDIKTAVEFNSDKKFQKLWNGDWEGDYPSQSEADLALCGMLASRVGDNPEEIDAKFRQSGLYRDKWDEVHYGDGRTYGEAMIEIALSSSACNYYSNETLQMARDYVRDAKESDNPTEYVFRSPEVIGCLALVAQNDTAGWALIKDDLKGAVNLNDLQKAVKEHARRNLRLVGDDERCKRIATLIEDEEGYSKDQVTQNGIVRINLSNFKLRVRDRLTMPSGEEWLGVDLIIKNKVRKLDLSHKAFVSNHDLLNYLPTADAVWLGSDKDVQLLKATLLEQEAPALKSVQTMGRHGDLIVMPKFVISAEGPVENPTLRLAGDIDPMVKKLAPSELPTEDSHRIAAEAIYKYLTRLNEATTSFPIIGWYFALPWAIEIKKDNGWGGFPHLVIWGSTGAGKTAYIELLIRLCGSSNKVEPFSLPGTYFTRMKKYSSTNLIPIFIDEYRSDTISDFERKKIHGELRSLYGGQTDERGNRNQSITAYELLSPIALAGEDRPRDPALEHRMIAINPSSYIIDEQINKDAFHHKDAFHRIEKAPLEAFPTPYWQWALSQDGWLERLESNREDIVLWAEKANLPVPNRITNNLAIVKFGWEMFEAYGKHLGLEPAQFVFGTIEEALQGLLRQVMPEGKTRSNLDDLMELIATMIKNGKLEYGSHFTRRRDGNVVVLLKDIHPEAKKYARETGRDKDVLGWDHYLGFLKEVEGKNDSYVKSKSERGDFEKDNCRRKQLYGILVDPIKLQEQLGIEAGLWSNENDPVIPDFEDSWETELEAQLPLS